MMESFMTFDNESEVPSSRQIDLTDEQPAHLCFSPPSWLSFITADKSKAIFEIESCELIFFLFTQNFYVCQNRKINWDEGNFYFRAFQGSINEVEIWRKLSSIRSWEN